MEDDPFHEIYVEERNEWFRIRNIQLESDESSVQDLANTPLKRNISKVEDRAKDDMCMYLSSYRMDGYEKLKVSFHEDPGPDTEYMSSRKRLNPTLYPNGKGRVEALRLQ